MQSHNFQLNRSTQILIQCKREEVYPPSHYAANFLEILTNQETTLRGTRVLDVGCGTGILGIAAAMLGARVVCSDLNPRALHCTKLNALLNSVEIDVVHSDGIEGFIGRSSFDLLICNPPSNPGFYDSVVTPRDNGPEGRGLLDEVLNNGYRVLTKDGRLLSCSNSEQNWRMTQNILEKKWDGYSIVSDIDEDFTALSQFSSHQLDEWVRKGVCWENEGKVFHNVRYFFAYK